MRSRKNIRLFMCGKDVYAETDVCVLDSNSYILLLAQEDKTHINPADPEAQFIAGATAAFQTNNRKRDRELFLPALDKQIIPGIMMFGTFPVFYKIEVTPELDQAIRFGQYPTHATIVQRHTPRVSKKQSEGMRPLDNRRKILQCYHAFRQFVPDN
jgi:hypothetical protein